MANQTTQLKQPPAGLTERELKLIKRHYWYPAIATPCVIVALALGALVILLEMIADLGFKRVGFNGLGLYTYLAIVVIYMVAFCYCTLACKLGKKQRAAWDALADKARVAQTHTDRSVQTAGAVGAMAAGRLMSKSDNDVVSGLGDVAQVAGAVEAAGVAVAMGAETQQNAMVVAEAFGIKLPSTKKVVAAIVAAPIVILLAVYGFMYWQTVTNRNEQMEIAAPRVAAVEAAFSGKCEEVRVSGPNANSQDEYEVQAYIRGYRYGSDELGAYVYVTLDKFGQLTKVEYNEYIDTAKLQEDNLAQVQADFTQLNTWLNSANPETLDPGLLKNSEFSDEFVQKFLAGSYSDSFYISADTDTYELDYSYYNYSNARFSIEIEYKKAN